MEERKRRKYTAEFKVEAVELVEKQGYKIAEAARSLGIRPALLSRWRQEYQTADQYLQENVADYIGLCRPLINEPGLISRWESGDTAESDCISCNGCGMASMSGTNLACVQKKNE